MTTRVFIWSNGITTANCRLGPKKHERLPLANQTHQNPSGPRLLDLSGSKSQLTQPQWHSNQVGGSFIPPHAPLCRGISATGMALGQVQQCTAIQNCCLCPVQQNF
jgi:hypothetical protein